MVSESVDSESLGSSDPWILFGLVALLPAASSSITWPGSSGSTIFGGLPSGIIWDVDAPGSLLLRFDCPRV